MAAGQCAAQSGGMMARGMEMPGFNEVPRAWALTQGLARVVGVSLPQAVAQGRLSHRDLAALVKRCQSCDCANKCMPWLAQIASAEAVPEFCPNKQGIEALVPRR